MKILSAIYDAFRSRISRPDPRRLIMAIMSVLLVYVLAYWAMTPAHAQRSGPWHLPVGAVPTQPWQITKTATKDNPNVFHESRPGGVWRYEDRPPNTLLILPATGPFEIGLQLTPCTSEAVLGQIKEKVKNADVTKFKSAEVAFHGYREPILDACWAPAKKGGWFVIDRFGTWAVVPPTFAHKPGPADDAYLPGEEQE